MARTDLTVKQGSARTPIVDLFASAAAVDSVNGMQFMSTGRRRLIVNNGSGAGITVTVKTPATADGLTVSDRVVAVAAGKLAVVWESPSGNNRQSDGRVYVDFSASATVTAVVVEDA